MCGIIGYVGGKSAAPILLDGLEKLEYRGYDSAGIAVINSNELNVIKTVKRIADLKGITQNGSTAKGNIGIGHTRWATHGAPTETNAHPHISYGGNFAVVHNGIIENYLPLKNELILKGVNFKSETDTEAIAHLLEFNFKGDVFNAIKNTLSVLSGSYALGILYLNSPDTLYAVKNFSPLIAGVGKTENFIASDITPLIPHTRDVIYLKDKEIAVITGDSLNIFDLSGRPKSPKIERITGSAESVEKGGYDHFMMKEIKEQPTVILKTATPHIKDGRVIFDGLNLTKEKIKDIKKIVITACGSAYHTGMVAKYVFEQLLKIPVSVDLASEFRYQNPVVDQNTLVIVISQSGETADTLAALNKAKDKGAYTLGIVNVKGSSIAKACHDTLFTGAGSEISVATTKAYSAQLIILYLFAVFMAGHLGTSDEKLRSALLNEIMTLPQKVQEIFMLEENIKALAKKHHTITDAFFIGRNLDYAVALEGALKLKEISYINCLGMAAGELKHGTISLIENGTFVLALAMYEKLNDKMLSNIKEVKARGANVLVVTFKGNNTFLGAADDIIYLPKTHPLLTPSLAVIPLQIFAYYIALFRGADIDKPRNLAKSVTVE